MKNKLIATLTTLTLVAAGPGVLYSIAQDFAEGPIGEINSIGEGAGLGGSSFAGSDLLQSPNVAFTPSGQAIEVFNPNVPTMGPGAESGGAASSDWITPDGRMNLQRGNAQTPEEALWAPEGGTVQGWTDGPLGLQVGIDWLFFSRGFNGGVEFGFLNEEGTSTGEVFTEQIDIDIESTARYRIGFASEYGTGYEFVAYDFNQFSGSLALSGERLVPVFFDGIPTEPVDEYNASYESRVKNFELNVWARRSENLRVGYGLRQLTVEDKYDIQFGASGGTTTGGGGFFSKTDNNLFGGQLMLELYRQIGPALNLEGGVKGMLLNNRMDLDLNTGNRDQSGEDSLITGGVNFRGGISYRAFRGVSLSAGYEGVFIGSVASGTAQSAMNDDFFEDISPFGEGLYFGGGYAGCTITF